MELAAFTPITGAQYMALDNPCWLGQTRVVDNHSWSCWKCGDQMVRTQSALLPDWLLAQEYPAEVAASNAAKHKFDVVANGTTYQLTELQLGTADLLMEQYVASGADAGSSEEVYEGIIREELGLNQVSDALFTDDSVNKMFPELSNLADMSNVTITSGPRPFVELGQSFDVVIPEVPYGDKAKLLSFEYRKSDSGVHEYYDLVLDGYKFDGVFAKQPENIVTGLVGQFGYGLRKFMLELPEVLHVPILKRIGKAVYPERKEGDKFYVEPTYVLLDERYYPYLKWTGDVHQVVGDQFGEKYFLRLLDAGFTGGRAASAAKFAGSLIGMDRDECEELLTILKLQYIPSVES